MRFGLVFGGKVKRGRTRGRSTSWKFVRARLGGYAGVRPGFPCEDVTYCIICDVFPGFRGRSVACWCGNSFFWPSLVRFVALPGVSSSWPPERRTALFWPFPGVSRFLAGSGWLRLISGPRLFVSGPPGSSPVAVLVRSGPWLPGSVLPVLRAPGHCRSLSGSWCSVQVWSPVVVVVRSPAGLVSGLWPVVWLRVVRCSPVFRLPVVRLAPVVVPDASGRLVPGLPAPGWWPSGVPGGLRLVPAPGWCFPVFAVFVPCVFWPFSGPYARLGGSWLSWPAFLPKTFFRSGSGLLAGRVPGPGPGSTGSGSGSSLVPEASGPGPGRFSLAPGSPWFMTRSWWPFSGRYARSGSLRLWLLVPGFPARSRAVFCVS